MMIEVEFVTKDGLVGIASIPQLPPPGYVIETGKGRPMLGIGGVLREGERPRVLVEHVLVDKEYSAVHVAAAAAPPHLAEASDGRGCSRLNRGPFPRAFVSRLSRGTKSETPSTCDLPQQVSPELQLRWRSRRCHIDGGVLLVQRTPFGPLTRDGL